MSLLTVRIRAQARQNRPAAADANRTREAATGGRQRRLLRVGMASSGKLGVLPSPLWGGVGGGGRSKDTTRCPRRMNREFGRSAIVRSCRRNAVWRVRCGRPQPKPSASFGGICATVSLRLARIFAAKFALTVTSPTLPVTRRALSSRSMAASTAQHQQPMKRARRSSKRTATGCLRYWNNDVLTNIDGVLEDILNTITTTPTPNPSPQGGGEHTEFVARVRRAQRNPR